MEECELCVFYNLAEEAELAAAVLVLVMPAVFAANLPWTY
jgi:hypothetical protein